MAGRGRRKKFGATQKDRIFFACLPDRPAVERIAALGEELKPTHGFTGALILPEHLHVTLFHLGDWITLPEEIVARASEAAAKVETAPFTVSFARIESFRNRTGVYPFVLSGDAASWRSLRDALGAALKQAGLGAAVHEADEFKPHVTLTYDPVRVKPAAIEPISWMVKDFVLIHSRLGKTEHIHLGRWSL